jgi:hypothetical protein
MLIRFVIEKLDSDSGRRQGLFQAAKTLRESGRLSKHHEEALEELRDWFNSNLERPERQAWSSKANAKAQALSWFKDTAAEHIGKMREFAAILEYYDLPVQMIKTERPGYILYEDEHQVAAYPFSDTQT